MGGISRKGAEGEKMSTKGGREMLAQEVYLETSRKAQEVYLETSRETTGRGQAPGRLRKWKFSMLRKGRTGAPEWKKEEEEEERNIGNESGIVSLVGIQTERWRRWREGR